MRKAKRITSCWSFHSILLAGMLLGMPLSAFDGDTFRDLAIGAVFEDHHDRIDTGLVHVLYCDSTGPTAINSQMFSQADPDMDEDCDEGDQFGRVMASGDFNGDGFADLAIGVPGEDVDDQTPACGGLQDDAGAVHVIYGSSEGLSASTIPDQFLTQKTPGISGEVYNNAFFGGVLCVGNFDGDRFDDLVIGMPNDNARTGVVIVIRGSDQGLDPFSSMTLNQDSDGILEDAESYDEFGNALASGDINGDGFDDLAIGVHYERIDDAQNAGCVNVVYGSISGLISLGNQCFWQGKDGEIQGGLEAGDQFGEALCFGDFNSDGFADLCISASRESFSRPGGGDVPNAGIVHVLYGSASGITTVDCGFFLNGLGVTGDYFGAALAAGDIDGDGFPDLIVGVPGNSPSGVSHAGVIHVLKGSESGLTLTGRQSYSQGDGFIPDQAEAEDNMGYIIAAGDLDHDGFCDVILGVPDESFEIPEPIGDVGAVLFVRGSASGLTLEGSREWTQSSGGIGEDAEYSDYFGASVAISVIPRQASCDTTGVVIEMPGTLFHPGDMCSCTVTVCNAEPTSIANPLFVILDVAGSYYFAPTFSAYDNYFTQIPEFAPGSMTVTVLPPFTWPAGTGSFYGCSWYAALTDPNVTQLVGIMDSWTFGWAE